MTVPWWLLPIALSAGACFGWCACALMVAASESTQVADEIMEHARARTLNPDVHDLSEYRRGITQTPESGQGA